MIESAMFGFCIILSLILMFFAQVFSGNSDPVAACFCCLGSMIYFCGAVLLWAIKNS